MRNAPVSAKWLLVLHLAIIAFSTAAMVTIMAGPPGPWATQEPAATVMRLSYRFAGATYVVLGTLAVGVFLSRAIGLTRALILGAAASAVSLAAELAGTTTGLPFGEYAYSSMLGYRILGRVPFPIPLSWFYMLVGALAIVARILPARNNARTAWTWSVLAALLLVAWDVSMDPAMVKTGHWLWGSGAQFRESGLPGWIVAFFTRDVFYGMPLSNWFGWLLTATIVARIMLSIVPATVVARRVATSRFPIVVFLANGVMPVALCLRYGFWWAALGGAAAMTVPAVIALRREPVLVPERGSVEPA